MEPTPPVDPNPANPPEPPPGPTAEPPMPPAPDPGISQTFTPTNRPSPPPPSFSPTPSGPVETSTVPAVASSPTPPPVQSQLPPNPADVTAPVTVGGDMPAAGPQAVFTATSHTVSSAGSSKLVNKKLLIPVAAVLVLLVGFAVYYFGYYANPAVIYSQSLKNTSKGYDKLINYADQRAKVATHGYSGSGSYQVKFSSFSTDGKISSQSGEGNGELTFDVGLAATRLNVDTRAIKSSGATPDFYVKIGGLNGGQLAGPPNLDPEFAKLDNSWIAIDHTLIDNLNAEAGQAGSTTAPSQEQIVDEARASGRVNQQYLFSTAKDKAVTKVVKKYGRETVDGHKTYHYQVALQKDNVKEYILAQRDALKASKLNDWLKQNGYDKTAYDLLSETAREAKNIKSSDTYDVWMDVSHRLIYKVRFNDRHNPANSYVDLGLNYKGGNDYPLFIAGKSTNDSSGDTTGFSLTVALNTKTNDITSNFNLKTDGSDAGTATANFTLKPNTSDPKISKPDNAIPLSQVLSDLGLGDLLNMSPTASADTGTQSSLQELQTMNKSGGGNSLQSAGGTCCKPCSAAQDSIRLVILGARERSC